MATARRLYLYVISGVGLSLLAAGGSTMLRTILNKAGVGSPRASSSFAEASDRDALALSIALVAVGLLLWLVHWALTIRMTDGDSETASAERASVVRSVYMALVLGVAFVAALSQFSDLVSNTIGDVVAKTPNATGMILFAPFDASWSLSIGVVLGAIWVYHAAVRRADVQREALTGAAAWISRLYLYGAVLVALTQMLGQLSTFVYAVVTSGLSNTQNAPGMNVAPFGITGAYYTHVEVVVVVAAVIWGAAALLHWLYSDRLREDPGARGELERRSRVRLAFLGLLVVSVAISVASGAASSLEQLLMWLLRTNTGSAFTADTLPLWYQVGAPLVATLPYVVAWLWARHRALIEEPAGPEGVSARRILGYGVALIGIVLLAAGAAQILTTLFSHVTSSAADSFPDAWKIQVSAGAAWLVVGFTLWIWPWMHAGNRREVEGTTETRSSSRSYYLYSINGGAIVAFAVSAAFILYKLLRVAMGQPETDVGLQLSSYFAVVFVAIGLVAFHTRCLLLDDGFDGRPRFGFARPGPIPYWTGQQPGGPAGSPQQATPPAGMPPAGSVGGEAPAGQAPAGPAAPPSSPAQPSELPAGPESPGASQSPDAPADSGTSNPGADENRIEG